MQLLQEYKIWFKKILRKLETIFEALFENFANLFPDLKCILKNLILVLKLKNLLFLKESFLFFDSLSLYEFFSFFCLFKM